MNFVNYLLQTNLYLLLFMSFYVLVLRNETFFRQNRVYLNSGIILSFLIPFMNSDWFHNLFITQKVREAALIPRQAVYDIIVIADTKNSSWWTMGDLAFSIYIAVTLCLFGRLLVSIFMIRAKLQTPEGKAFSFFNTLVVDPSLPNAETIISHERVHIRQWHSVDIVLIELAGIINWFNPVVYLYKKEIKQIHEFIADEEAAGLMQSKSDYAMLLFTNSIGANGLSNNFFNSSLLKRRIIMLNKSRSGKVRLWKYGFSTPLFAAMLIVSAAVASSQTSNFNINSSSTIKSLEDLAAVTLNPAASKGSSPAQLSPELHSDKANGEHKKIAENISPGSIEHPAGPITGEPMLSPDYSELKRHLQRAITYPFEARSANQIGFTLLDFTVENQKITDSRVRLGMIEILDNEALRALRTYTGLINVPNGKHSITFQFRLIGDDVTAIASPNVKPAISPENFAGEITVVAYKLNAGTLVRQPSQDNSASSFGLADKLPEFEGGLDNWAKYLQENLKYPTDARSRNITGRVVLSFIVEKDGSISDIKVLRGVGGGLDEEAVRVLKQSPKWIPGSLKGEPIRTAFTLPITFQLPAKPDTKP